MLLMFFDKNYQFILDIKGNTEKKWKEDLRIISTYLKKKEEIF